MFWPRLTLTPAEKKYATKYFDPVHGRGTLRRMYPGFLEINANQNAPFWNFQIARRCRIFALTGIGDVSQMRIQLQDSSGEQYFVDPQIATNVFGGWAQSGNQAGILPIPTSTAEASTGMTFYVAPLVFEPSIVLKPNQTLNILGYPVSPYVDGRNYRIDFCIHVWEFPNYVDPKTLAEK
jgi:hypothetical protein